jgi:hypothetical protein
MELDLHFPYIFTVWCLISYAKGSFYIVSLPLVMYVTELCTINAWYSVDTDLLSFVSAPVKTHGQLF